MPYSSSHLDGTQSEKIVPSDHGAHQIRQGMQEVRRILVLNIRQEGESPSRSHVETIRGAL
ncbi:MAG: hypothetical protein JOY96_02745 [Verrucomicrobia bacterium]|nr:hypothetical protein [Verrucomicrobiota bacterium]